MDTLSAFLPVDRRRALADGRELPDRTLGAALFADISGFTPLTAALRRELGARRGAEEVVRHIDRVHSALIERVHGFHGDIIGFSGDAILCWFEETLADNPDGRLESAARAVACAMELQDVMTHLQDITTPAGTTFPLEIKVAVATGPARRFLVGDPNLYVVEVLAGAMLDRMATAEELAGPGEVVVAANVLTHLDPTPPVAEWRVYGGERFATLTGPVAYTTPFLEWDFPALGEAARPWILPPVYDQLQQGSAEFLAELRPAVSVFIRFSGIDYDHDPDAGQKLDAFVRRAQAIFGHYEGYLLQITTGDKGSYLYASFGAPVAHERDVSRAAAAALEIRELPAALDFLHPLQIGMSRGLVHSGAYGSPQRRTYGVMGNNVNISARLMGAAQPGQILISPRVAEAVGVGFHLRELSAVRLKGIAEPLATFELLGRKISARTAISSRSLVSMVGRESELATLDLALGRLSDGRSTVLMIEGGAGLGKSLLVQELVHKTPGAVPTALVLAGNGDAIERSTPYFGWRPIFERLFMEGDSLTDAAWRDGVIARLDPTLRPLAPLLNAVLPLDLAENEFTEQLTGESRQESAHRLLLNLLRSADDGAPLMLVFDDVHWLDSVSWTLIGRAQREIEPLLLALATRPLGDETPSVYTELRALPATQSIVLDTLPRPAVEALVAERLGVRNLSPAVARLLHEKAEGHPFFSEELAYALRDAGLIQIVDDEARPAPNADLTALDFPNTVQGVITSRIDLLPPQQQLTVKVASVIGRIFAFRALSDIYPIQGEEARLHENLDRLARLEITPQETPEPNLAYIFKHIVTQEVVYSLMTSAQRQQLHRRMALWYENAGEADQNRSIPLLAHHWRLAGEAERAIVYYEKAGENAVRDYANQEAIRFFEQALELSGPNTSPLQRARWRRLMGEARYRLTLIEGSIADYEAGLALLDRPIPASSTRRALGVGRELARQVGHRLLPSRLVGRAAPTEAAALLEASHLYEGVAEIYYNLGDFLTSFYCTMTSFNLAESAGPSPELMRGYANMCATMGSVGLNGPAESYRARALDTAVGVDDPPTTAWIQVPLSIYSLWIGAWERAEEEIGVALEIYSRLGEWRRWCVAAWVWPQVAQSKGELGRARELWAELYAVARRSDDTRHQVRGRGGQYFNYLSLGQFDEADACVEAVGEIMAGNPEMAPVEERLWHGINAVAALRRGDWPRARESAHEQLAAIGRARFKFDLLEVFAAPAEVFLALRERDQATANEAAEGCKVLNSYARTYAFARPRALRMRGRLAWLEGDERRAAKFWQKSAAQALSLKMPYEQALTLREMGRHLDDASQIAEADKLFSQLGCDLPIP